MPISEEHLRLLKKQGDLVNQLKEILAAQQRALEQLGSIDEDYDSAQVKESENQDSDNEGELSSLQKEAERREANTKPKNVAITADEKAQPNVEYEEPTEEAERGFMATKPWLGAMAPPTNWSWSESGTRDQEPTQKLELQHIHGYRSRACRNNTFYIDDNTILYYAAAVGIIHNVSTKTQKFFQGHTDDILSMDYNPVKRWVASGQSGKPTKLCVWSVDDPSTTIVAFEDLKRAVVSVSFSPDGSRLVAVGLDDNHSISVYDLERKTLILNTKGDTNRIIAAAWNTSAGANPNLQFVTVGVKHINFWTVNGGIAKAERGLVSQKGELQGFLDVAFTSQGTLVACENGQVYQFEANKMKSIQESHNGACFSIQALAGNQLITGGRDGFVNCFKNGKNFLTLDFNKQDSGLGLNSIKSLSVNPRDASRVLVGTITSSIYEANLTTKKIKCIVSNHFGDLSKADSYGELWGLTVHPSQAQFASAAEDNSIRTWSIATREPLGRGQLAGKGISLSYSPNGKLIAAGLEDGTVQLLNALDLTELSKFKKRDKRITIVRFSPDGLTLAVGVASGLIDLVSIDNGDDLVYAKTLTGNASAILSLDFSADGKFLQSSSAAYELLFYNVTTGAQETKSRSLKDTEWSTFTSILGWSVQGIWPKFSDGSDINCVGKSRNGRLLVSAEDSGAVRLFNYPCVGSGLDKAGSLARRPNSVQGNGHSEHVTRVEFSSDDKFVISSGGADNSIMVWKLV